MRGLTTLRDAGGPSDGLAKAIEYGIFSGPRIYSSGHFEVQLICGQHSAVMTNLTQPSVPYS